GQRARGRGHAVEGEDAVRAAVGDEQLALDERRPRVRLEHAHAHRGVVGGRELVRLADDERALLPVVEPHERVDERERVGGALVLEGDGDLEVVLAVLEGHGGPRRVRVPRERDVVAVVLAGDLGVGRGVHQRHDLDLARARDDLAVLLRRELDGDDGGRGRGGASGQYDKCQSQETALGSAHLLSPPTTSTRRPRPGRPPMKHRPVPASLCGPTARALCKMWLRVGIERSGTGTTLTSTATRLPDVFTDPVSGRKISLLDYKKRNM